MPVNEDLPGDWETGIRTGNVGDTYTQTYYLDDEDLEIEQYYDEQGDDRHKVVVYKVEKDENGDVLGSEPRNSWYASTEGEAEELAVEKMRALSRGELEV